MMRSEQEIQSAKKELATTVEAIKSMLLTGSDDSDLPLLLAVSLGCRVVLEWVLGDGKASGKFNELVEKLKENTRLASNNKVAGDVQ